MEDKEPENEGEENRIFDDVVFHKYLDEVTDEEWLEFWEDIQ